MTCKSVGLAGVVEYLVSGGSTPTRTAQRGVVAHRMTGLLGAGGIVVPNACYKSLADSRDRHSKVARHIEVFNLI